MDGDDDANAETTVKERITVELQLAIKSLHNLCITDSSSVIYSSNVTNELCYAIEAVFLHGLRAAVPRKPDKWSFWKVLVTCSHWNVIEKINKLSQIETDIGRCRAWVRMTLNGADLASYLAIILSDNDTLAKYYDGSSYLRDTEQSTFLMTAIQGLERLRLSLSYNSNILNMWTGTAPSLVGLEPTAVTSSPSSSSMSCRRDSANVNTPSLTSTIMGQQQSCDERDTSFDDFNLLSDERNEISEMFQGLGSVMKAATTITTTTTTTVLKPPETSTDDSLVLGDKLNSFTASVTSSTDSSNGDENTRSDISSTLSDTSLDSFNTVRCGLSPPIVCSLTTSFVRRQKYHPVNRRNGSLRRRCTSARTKSFSESLVGEVRTNFKKYDDRSTSTTTTTTLADGVVSVANNNSGRNNISSIKLSNHRYDHQQQIGSFDSGCLLSTTSSVKSLDLSSSQTFCASDCDVDPTSDFAARHGDDDDSPFEPEPYSVLVSKYIEVQPVRFKSPGDSNISTADNLKSSDVEAVDVMTNTLRLSQFFKASQPAPAVSQFLFDDWIVIDSSHQDIKVQPYHVDESIAHMVPYMTKQYPPKPLLLHDNNRCHGCLRSSEQDCCKQRVCSFTGQYFCKHCFGKNLSVLPSEVVYNWNFTKYRVSTDSHSFLSKVYDWPMLDISEVNPNLYLQVKNLSVAQVVTMFGSSIQYLDQTRNDYADVIVSVEFGAKISNVVHESSVIFSRQNDVNSVIYFHVIDNLRIKLSHVVRYMLACTSRDCEKFWRMVNTCWHTFQHPHHYSLKELEGVQSGSYVLELRKIVHLGIRHIGQCSRCVSCGFICEICKSDDVIYPYDIDSTVTCADCHNVYHRRCYSNQCVKCGRLRQRKLSVNAAHNPIELVVFSLPDDIASNASLTVQ